MIHLLEILTSSFLIVTKEKTIIVLLLVGYVFFNKRVFLNAVSLLLLTMVYNSFLKELWQKPLNPSLNVEGWAFPSGHMHSSFVWIGYITWHYKRYFFVLLSSIILIIGIGFSLIFKGYHDFSDVLGALGFGIVTLVFSVFIESLGFFKKRVWVLPSLFLFLSLLLHCVFLSYKLNQDHLFLANGALLGLSLSSWLVFKIEKGVFHSSFRESFLKNCFIFFITLFGLAGIFYLGFKLKLTFDRNAVIFLTYAFASCWMVMASIFIGKLLILLLTFKK